jgi:hypothetical protein
MRLRYPPEEFTKPSIMLLRSLAIKLGLKVSKEPGGYGGLRMERKRLGELLKENIKDARLSEMDRDTIKYLE